MIPTSVTLRTSTIREKFMDILDRAALALFAVLFLAGYLCAVFGNIAYDWLCATVLVYAWVPALVVLILLLIAKLCLWLYLKAPQ